MLELALESSHGHAGERDPDRLRYDAVANCVCNGRVANNVEPLGDGNLRRDYGGVESQAILDDLKQ